MKKQILMLTFLFGAALALEAAPAARESYEPQNPPTQKVESAEQACSYAVVGPYSRSLDESDLEKSGTISLQAWRGERVNSQILIRAHKDLVYKTGRFERVKESGKSNLTINDCIVRNVMANKKLMPDVLDYEKDEIIIKVGEPRLIWISCDVPANARVGKHEFALQLAEGVTVPCTIEVLEPKLPKPGKWKFHLDLWQTPESAAVYHRVEPYSQAHFDLMRPNMERLAQAGQKCITCTIMYESWDHQSYADLPGQIKWTKYTDVAKDGTTSERWEYDYTLFDKWVEYCMDCGITEQISCYTMIPWGLNFRYYDAASRQYVTKHMEPSSAEYEAYWGTFLTDFAKHLKAKKWYKITKIGIDERPKKLIEPALKVLNKYAPGLGVESAVNSINENVNHIDSVSPSIRYISGLADAINERRAREQRTLFYVCCHPPVPNTFTISQPAESTWLPLYASANNLAGFLRWAYDNYSEQPLRTTDYGGPHGTWETGDCFLVYPGNRSSIRFENLRDGIEVFEKIRLLREKGLTAESALEKYLKENFVFEKRNQSQAGKKENLHVQDIERVETLINEEAKSLL